MRHKKQLAGLELGSVAIVVVPLDIYDFHMPRVTGLQVRLISSLRILVPSFWNAREVLRGFDERKGPS